jgi:hypothetical protein
MFDYFFWFVQPSSILSSEDKIFLYIFAALVLVSILFRVAAWLVRNKEDKKLLMKVWHWAFWIGISGLLWFAMRNENTPIFGRRYWAGIVIIAGIIWLLFILKYLIFNYPKLRSEYFKQQVKNKYIPGSK